MKLLKISVVLSLAIIFSLLATVVPATPSWALVGAISITPASGPVGTAVAVTGSGFTAGSTYTVKFDAAAVVTGTVAADSTLTPSQYFPVPPSTAGSHIVTVTTTAPDTSNSVTFTITPQIVLSPPSGHTGDSIIVAGDGFGASATVTIYFDSTAITSTTNNVSGSFVISLAMPTVTAGYHTVTATDSLANTASTTFSINPAITISPSSVAGGSQVTVNGSGFAASSTVTIYIDSIVQTSTASTASGTFSMSLTVPQGTGGYHTITATDSLANTVSATYSVTPSITIAPRSVTGGSQVTIPGAGFGAGSTVTIYIIDTATTTTTI